jgi:hypothetical protein
VVAFLIFLVAGALAAGVSTLAARVMGDTELGKVVVTAGPILIMTIATFMILDQLKIAHDIVVLTYAALIGAIALGSALAFGLGGRDVGGRMLEGAHTSAQENKGQPKRDLDPGLARARAETEDAKQRMSDDDGSTAATARGSSRARASSASPGVRRPTPPDRPARGSRGGGTGRPLASQPPP